MSENKQYDEDAQPLVTPEEAEKSLREFDNFWWKPNGSDAPDGHKARLFIRQQKKLAATPPTAGAGQPVGSTAPIYSNATFKEIAKQPQLTSAIPAETDLEARARALARELHAYFNSEGCGFFDDGNGPGKKCLDCEAVESPLLAFAKLAAAEALEEAAQVIDQCNREGPYNAIQGASRIRELIASPTKEPSHER